MTFLAPAFLAGLAALAVPVLVHLAHRSRGKPTPFPSLHFLRRIPFRSRRRRVLRHPLLFALRVAALALLVLAFARPVLPGGGSADPAADAREVVLLLDRSYSMGYRDRWERAVAGLRSELAGLAPGDRVSLVAFSDRAETLVGGADDPEAVRAALGGLAPDHRTTRYEAGFRIAGRILEGSERSRKEVVIATDFQAVGWADRTPLALPTGTEVRAVDVSDPEPANLTLSDLALSRAGGRGLADLAVRVSNVGSAPASGVRVRLEVNGRVAGSRQVEIPPGSAATVRFAGVALPDGGARGTLRLDAPAEADGLPADDALHFYAAPVEALRVRVVESGRGGADRSLYVRRALAIGDRPPVALERAARTGTPAVEEVDLVVLNDADVSDAGAAAALAGFVEAGGGVLVALGTRSEPSRWPEAARRLLPGRVGEAVDRVEGGGARLATVERDHPVFLPFRAPRSGDLSAARFLRYRRIEPDTSARVLARFDDGAPALVEAAVGEGRAVLWASTLDRSWNDLPVQPVYLPLVHGLAVHAAGWSPAPRFRTVGEPLDVAALLERRAGGAGGAVAGSGGGGAGGDPGKAEWIVAAPGGERQALRVEEGDAVVLLHEPGFWQVRRLDGDGPAIDVAVNLDPSESDLRPLDRAELLAAAGAAPDAGSSSSGAGGPGGTDPGVAGPGAAGPGAAGPGAAGATAGASEADEEPPGREIWWPLLLVATALLLAEAELARRLDRRSPLPAPLARAARAGTSERRTR